MMMENKGGYYTNEMLQAVTKQMQKECISQSAGNMPKEETSTKTNNSVSKNVWMTLTGHAAESLVKAFFGPAVVVLQENKGARSGAEEGTAEEDAAIMREAEGGGVEVTGRGGTTATVTTVSVLKTYRIVLLGKTTAGKSSLANTIFGEDVFEIKHTPICGTSECQAESKSVHGRRITVIDTPGFFDTDRSEEELKREIVRCITECAPGPHAFFIVLKVEKFTEQERDVIAKIFQYFSEEALKYAAVVFTHGDQLPEGQTIEDFVDQNKCLSDLVKKCGGRCHVVDNKYWKNNHQGDYRSNKFQVAELLNTTDKIVMENKGGCYTNEMLQAVKREIEEEGNTTSVGNMPHQGELKQGDISNKADENTVSKNVWIKLTGPAAESLEAEEGEVEEEGQVATKTKKEAEQGGQAAVGGGLGKFIGSIFGFFSWIGAAAVGAVATAAGVAAAAIAIAALTLGGLIVGAITWVVSKMYILKCFLKLLCSGIKLLVVVFYSLLLLLYCAAVGGGLGKFIGSLFELFSGIAEAVGDRLRKVMGSLFGLFSGIGAVAAGAAAAAIAIVALTLGGLIVGAITWVVSKMYELKCFLKLLCSGIKLLVVVLYSLLLLLYCAAVVGGLGKFMGSLFGFFSGIAAAVGDGLRQFMGSLFGFFSGIALDKMKVILLTAIVFTVALVLGGQGVFSNGNRLTSNQQPRLEERQKTSNILVNPVILTKRQTHPEKSSDENSDPCQEESHNSAYKTFVHRHILKNSFDRNSTEAWKSYLEDSNLCGRTPVQSFIDADEIQVRQICSEAGRWLQGNLCISNSDMEIYDVVSKKNNNGCKVESAKPRKHKVIIACNNLNNVCRPVHYEKYNNCVQPGNIPCV